MKNINSHNPIKLIINLIKRFNLIIFIVIVVIGLIAYVIILGNALSNQQPTVSNSPNGATSFDQSTIDLLNNMTASSESTSNQALPPGRNNPFTE